MFEAIYAFFQGSELFAARSIFYFLLVGVIVGFFVMCIARAVRDKFAAHKGSTHELGSERTTETTTARFNRRLN